MDRKLKTLEIFEAALDIPPDEREAYVDSACEGDVELFKAVQTLLSNADECDDFIATSDGSSNSDPGHQQAQTRLGAGDRLQDRYEIEATLGVGGMGEVYRARDNRLERDVAIKVLKWESHSSDELRNRFDRELKSVASLSSPNVVTLYDFASHDDLRFAVMELAEGHTLRELIADGVNLSTGINIGQGIASGLSAAHARDVMHRDIKPENVVVGHDGVAKILDFGLARRGDPAVAQRITQTSMTPGTIPYMSPEQAEGRELTCATDIFSLGTVLFEMLSGSNPFRHDTALATLNSVAEAAPPDLSSLASHLPERLVALVHSMLTKEPTARPAAHFVAEQFQQMTASLQTDGPSAAQGAGHFPQVAQAGGTTNNNRQTATRAATPKWQPSLIVMPFVVFGDAPDTELLADGLVENLTTILTRIPMLSVTSRMSSFSLKGQSLTASDVRRKFKVDYMIEGSLQRFGDNLRANVQLVETEGEFHVWAQQFDCPFDSNSHDSLLRQILSRLESQLTRAIFNALRDESGELNGRQLLVQAMSLLSLKGWHRDSFQEVAELLRRSLELEPNLAITHAYLALIQGVGIRVGLVADPKAATTEAIARAESALELDDLDSNVLGLAGCALTDVGEVMRGEDILRNAIEINPNNAQAHAALGTSSLVSNDPIAAIEHLRKGIELSPMDGRLAVWYASLAVAYLQADNVDAALEAARLGCQSDRKTYLPRVALAAVLLVRGEVDEAGKALIECLRVKPDLSHDEVNCLVGRKLGLAIRKLRRQLEK